MVRRIRGQEMSDHTHARSGDASAIAPSATSIHRITPLMTARVILVTVFTVVTIVSGGFFLSGCGTVEPEPTAGPTATPTAESTEAPTAAPTAESTEAPTGEDIAVPNDNPYIDHCGSGNALFPGSDERYLGADDLENLSAEALVVARTEIMARHGMIFEDAALAEYFDLQSWYVPSIPEATFTAESLNDYESTNIQLIRVYERILNGDYAPAEDNPYMACYDPATELLLPEIRTTALTEQDLGEYDPVQLIIIRNQLLAMHGYAFHERELMAYFLQCSWYRPSVAPGRPDLITTMSELEQANFSCLWNYMQTPLTAAELEALDSTPTMQEETDVYTLQLPAYWRRHSIIIPRTDKSSGMHELSFHESMSYDALGGGGWVFSLLLIPADREYEFPQYTFLGSLTDAAGSNWDVVVQYPSDVQFAIDHMALYQKMGDQVESILQSLTFKSGYTFTPA